MGVGAEIGLEPNGLKQPFPQELAASIVFPAMEGSLRDPQILFLKRKRMTAKLLLLRNTHMDTAYSLGFRLILGSSSTRVICLLPLTPCLGSSQLP